MDKLVFRDFTWPRNPEEYQVSWLREPVYEKNDAGVSVFTGMGPGKCTITGKGVFSGDTAYEDFKTLAGLFEEGSLGTLTDGTWGDFSVYLTELELTQEPRSDYVAYRFQFARADADGAIPQ